MPPETFCEQFATFAEAPHGVAKLRELILQLAVQGKLGTHDVNDAPVCLKMSKESGSDSISSNWKNGILGDVIVLEYGDNLPASKRSGTGEYPVYGSNGIVGTHSAYLTKAPAIIVGRKGSAGALNIADGPSWTTDVAYYVCPPPEFDLRFTFYLLSSLNLDLLGKGIKPGLSRKEAYELPVAIPPLAEQRRIVGKVDQLLGLCDELAARQAARREARSALVGATLDRLVSASWDRLPACHSAADQNRGIRHNIRQLNESAEGRQAGSLSHAHRLRDHFDRLFDTPTTLPQLRQAILQLAVQGQLVPQDPNDEPVEKFLQANDQERLRRLENGTIRTKTNNDADTVKQSLELSQFIDYRGKTPTRTPAGVRLITAKNVRMGSVENEPVEFVTEKQYEQWMTRGFPEIGDLLLVTDGHTMDFVGMLDLPFRFALAQRTINLQPFVKAFNKYLLYYLMSPRFQSDVVRNSTGSAAKGIKASKLKQLLIAVPPLSEQQRIVSKVTELLSLCDALEAKLTQADSVSSQLLAAAIHHMLNSTVQSAS
ncbi:MAG: restriction endonuclease subunit S [Planctomycetia bacterium]|nr:restriction endonuclease subunit S [Planctomycetia bacterium]